MFWKVDGLVSQELTKKEKETDRIPTYDSLLKSSKSIPFEVNGYNGWEMDDVKRRKPQPKPWPLRMRRIMGIYFLYDNYRVTWS